jgi:hypothetical protein
MSTLPLFDPQPLTPLQRKEVGMEKVARHANQLSPEWTNRASALFVEYAYQQKLKGETFLTEDFGDWATKYKGLEKPHDDRVYGPVAARAVRDGVVKRINYKPDKFGSPKSEWEAL